jgi:hypothetical protein
MTIARARHRPALPATAWPLLGLLLLGACSGGGGGGSTAPPPPASLAIATKALPQGMVGEAYESTLDASGGTPPYAWKLREGTLPPGLLLDQSSGVISGTPVDQANAVALTLMVSDAGTPAQTRSVTLPLTVLEALTITTSALPDGHVGSPYAAALAATGGVPPYTWVISAGALPTGLKLNAGSGALSGVPSTNSAAAMLTFQVSDSQSPAVQASATLPLTITAVPLLITTTALADATVGQPYSATLAYSGGTGAVSWTLSSGTLPPGLKLNAASGALTGTPASPVSQTPLTFTATDSGTPQQQQNAAFPLSIDPSGIVVDVTPHRAGIAIGQALTLTASINDGAGVRWSVSPAGGSFKTATSLDGVPNTFTAPLSAGAYTISVTSISDPQRLASVTVGVTDLTGIYTQHNDAARSGANTQEYALTTANVTAATFGKLSACAVDGAVYAQPLWVANLAIAGVPHNVVFVATEHDSLYAFDADASPCQMLWQVSLLDAAHGVSAAETPIISGGPGHQVGSGYGDITPETGITGTPVIDPATQILYLVAKSVLAGGGGNTFYQRLHAIDLASGAERAGAPVLISASYPRSSGGTVTFDTRQELQRAGLALLNGTVYVAWGAHEDASPWYGWLIGYTYNGMGFTQAAVLNVAPDTGESGIWMGGGAPAVDAAGRLYATTGNGQFDASHTTAPADDYGDSFLQLTPGGASGIGVSAYFTPTDEATDYSSDADAGAGGAALVINLGSAGSAQHVLVGGGKDGALYVLDGDRLGGYGDANALQRLPLGHPIFSTAAFWNGTLYVAPVNSALLAYAFNSATLQLATSASSKSPNDYGFPGSTPVVSASGPASNGIVWALNNDAYCTAQSQSCGPAVLHAYDAAGLGNELWNSAQIGTDAAGNAVKFTVPTVANGKVYVGTRGNNTGGAGSSTSVAGELDIYGLKPN